eukprot:m51a1_g12208 hypothetical protein (477) ;mRNA; f:3942-6062
MRHTTVFYRGKWARKGKREGRADDDDGCGCSPPVLSTPEPAQKRGRLAATPSDATAPSAPPVAAAAAAAAPSAPPAPRPAGPCEECQRRLGRLASASWMATAELSARVAEVSALCAVECQGFCQTNYCCKLHVFPTEIRKEGHPTRFKCPVAHEAKKGRHHEAFAFYCSDVLCCDGKWFSREETHRRRRKAGTSKEVRDGQLMGLNESECVSSNMLLDTAISALDDGDADDDGYAVLKRKPDAALEPSAPAEPLAPADDGVDDVTAPLRPSSEEQGGVDESARQRRRRVAAAKEGTWCAMGVEGKASLRGRWRSLLARATRTHWLLLASAALSLACVALVATMAALLAEGVPSRSVAWMCASVQRAPNETYAPSCCSCELRGGDTHWCNASGVALEARELYEGCYSITVTFARQVLPHPKVCNGRVPTVSLAVQATDPTTLQAMSAQIVGVLTPAPGVYALAAGVDTAGVYAGCAM